MLSFIYYANKMVIVLFQRLFELVSHHPSTFTRHGDVWGEIHLSYRLITDALIKRTFVELKQSDLQNKRDRFVR